jgi:hypothetical protein
MAKSITENSLPFVYSERLPFKGKHLVSTS